MRIELLREDVGVEFRKHSLARTAGVDLVTDCCLLNMGGMDIPCIIKGVKMAA